MDSLRETLQSVLTFRDERDWAQFHTPKDLAAAIAIEASELQEDMLWKSKEEVRELIADADQKERLARELADVFIFGLLFYHAIHVDPIDAIRRKLELNEKNYPAKLAKGKAIKYTRLSKE